MHLLRIIVRAGINIEVEESVDASLLKKTCDANSSSDEALETKPIKT